MLIPQIRYVEDDLAGMAEVSSDEEEAEPEEPGSPVAATAMQADRRKKAPQIREPVVPTGPPPPPPLLEGEGKGLKVLGFSHKQRTTFVKVSGGGLPFRQSLLSSYASSPWVSYEQRSVPDEGRPKG